MEIREDIHQELNNFLNSIEDDTTEPEPDTLNLFAVSVWIPCMCLCGRSPDKLFHEAAAGDFESLCTLIRLDRTAQNIPEISQHIAECKRLRHKHKMRLMALEEARRGYVDQYKNAEHIKLAVIQRLLNYVQSIEQLKLLKVKHFTQKRPVVSV